MNTIHNARVQLLATALNNLGVGAIIAGLLAPAVNLGLAGWQHGLPWLAGGISFIGAAQAYLGRLK